MFTSFKKKTYLYQRIIFEIIYIYIYIFDILDISAKDISIELKYLQEKFLK